VELTRLATALNFVVDAARGCPDRRGTSVAAQR
jgi:hypothetical protein